MAFCLTKELADKLTQAAKRGEIDIATMYDMTSAQRNSLFQKYVDANTAKQINAGFESAMISNQQTALKNWAKRTFGQGEKLETRRKDIMSKIERLQETGLLTPKNQESFLSDLVATRLGVTVTAEEAGVISERATQLQELYEKTNEFGLPTEEYFKARREIEDYIESLTPSSQLKVATSIIGRGSMLFSLKSPLLNIESNTVQGVLTAFERRAVSRRLSGVNNDYAKRFIRFVINNHKNSQFDVTRMRTLDDQTKIRGEQITTSQGEGRVRAAGRFYEDVVFNKLMSAPDVAFSAVHFADSANLTSTQIAKAEGLKGSKLRSRALEIFKDATRIDPQTIEGIKVREQAIADAEYATYTNKSKYSDVALGIRALLNKATGDIRLGDQLMPFVKTPANVVGAGVDVSGVLLPVDTALRVVKIVNAIRSGETVSEATLENFQGYSRKLVRAGFGLTLAFIVSSLFDPEDFIGEWPTSQKEQELLRLKNATTNSVKIGDKWVSLDYFGPLGTPLVAMLYAKKYGGGKPGGALYSYYVGAGRQLTKIPGLEIGKDVFETLSRTKFEGSEAIVKELRKGLVDYLRSRTIPAFIYDIAKATDKFDRQKDRDDPLDSVLYAIPLLRQGLPTRINIFGKEIENEPGVSTILFGSRVKTVEDDPVVTEITRLSETGNLPSITDYAKTSSRFKALKEQIGDDRYREAELYLGNTLYDKIEKAVNSTPYQRASDDKKAAIINKIKSDTLEMTLRKYGYKK